MIFFLNFARKLEIKRFFIKKVLNKSLKFYLKFRNKKAQEIFEKSSCKSFR